MKTLGLLAKNIIFLMRRHGIESELELATATGIPQPTIWRIINGESLSPRDSTVQPIADYFCIDIATVKFKDLSMLSSGSNELGLDHPMTSDEKRLIESYRKLTKNQQQVLREKANEQALHNQAVISELSQKKKEKAASD